MDQVDGAGKRLIRLLAKYLEYKQMVGHIQLLGRDLEDKWIRQTDLGGRGVNLLARHQEYKRIR
jgi:hypothetical protein